MLFKNVFNTSAEKPRVVTFSSTTKPGSAPRARLLERFHVRRTKTPELPKAIFPSEFPRLPDPTVRTTYQQPIKYKTNNDDDGAKDQRPRKVGFQDQTQVTEIPSHRDYDTITRRKLWRNRQEIYYMKLRNRAEVKADGGSKNWRDFTEEDEMLEFAGNLFHPATHARLQKRQEQMEHRRRAAMQVCK